MILHIDMDAFFASIEQAINPRLKNKPLIVGSRASKLHTVVCAASYEAKALGIHSGMPSKEALALCPKLEFVPAQQERYIWTSEQIFKILKTYALPVEYASIDEFRIDAGTTHEPLALAKDIRIKINKNFHITASVGIAENRLLSKLASKLNKPNGIAMLNKDNLTQTLAKTPVEKLCGIGEKSTEVLHTLGVKTCLELYEKPSRFLEAAFGQYGLNMYLNLHSEETIEEPETLQENSPKSIGHSYTFSRASNNPVFIHAWIRLLAAMAAKRLREQELSAYTVHLWLNGPEIGIKNAQKTFTQATNDDYEIAQRAAKIMHKLCLKTPQIRALSITCSHLEKANYPPLFREQKKREDLIKSMDAINRRFGEDAIYPAIITLAKKSPDKQ